MAKSKNPAVLGFDFGTTNSLASVVLGGRAITFFDKDRSIPSVVSFEGGKVEVGRRAHDKLSGAGLGVQGSIVRSPKTLLGQEELIIDGVRRDPVQIVQYVLDHVRQHVLQSNEGDELSMEQVVATIPVNMHGRRRALLREAFGHAGMSVVQFVHEPLAALYGYLRNSGDAENLVRRYEGKLLLVFDWGGGTLDLTLCRVLDGMLIQIANDGTDEVGGDVFDETLRNEVEQRAHTQAGLDDDVEILPEARKRLMHECEQAKIQLSSRATRTIFVDHYYQADKDSALEFQLLRDDMQEIVGHLVQKGVSRIERLLEREGYSTASVELCLATGGMVNMPLVTNRLHELFGPGRVEVSKAGAAATAEGAAWVAHDKARLHLAKNVELTLARNTYLPLLEAGFEMPLEREHRDQEFMLYCADPTDGFGKFSLVSPHRPGPHVLPDDKRRPLCSLMLKVDAQAHPFRERLVLNTSIDENLILHLEAWSMNQKGRAAGEIHDLEFALATPGKVDSWDRSRKFEEENSQNLQNEPGDLVVRSNLAKHEDDTLVPGEVMARINPTYFWTHGRHQPPQIQVDERLYYEPCSVCGRHSNDPLCHCSELLDSSTTRQVPQRHG